MPEFIMLFHDYDLDDFVHSTSQVYLLVLQNRALCCQILSLKMMTTRLAAEDPCLLLVKCVVVGMQLQ